jgi:hypothetical protein
MNESGFSWLEIALNHWFSVIDILFSQLDLFSFIRIKIRVLEFVNSIKLVGCSMLLIAVNSL